MQASLPQHVCAAERMVIVYCLWMEVQQHLVSDFVITANPEQAESCRLPGQAVCVVVQIMPAVCC